MDPTVDITTHSKFAIGVFLKILGKSVNTATKELVLKVRRWKAVRLIGKVDQQDQDMAIALGRDVLLRKGSQDVRPHHGSGF